MSVARDELEEFRDDALSDAARQAFRASAEATARWDRAHPLGIEGILDWIDELRRAFGDPPLDRRPWRGDDFRL